MGEMEKIKEDIADIKVTLKSIQESLQGSINRPGVFEEVRGTKAAVASLENHTVQIRKDVSEKIASMDVTIAKHGADIDSLNTSRTRLIAWASGISLGGGTVGSFIAKLFTSPPHQ